MNVVDRWLFAPEPAARLHALRTGIAAVLAFRLAVGPFSRLGGQPAALFRPVWFLQWLDQMPSHDVLLAFQAVGAAAALLAVVGWRARGTFLVAWASLLVLEGCLASRGKVQHNALPLLLVAGILAFAPIAARRDEERSPAWGWPVRTSIVVVTGVYFLTGFQKLVSSGPAWVFSDNLRNVLYAAPLGDHAPTDAVSRAIADRAWLARVVALGTITIELGGILALAWARARPAYVAAIAVLHGGVYLTLGLDYSLWVATAAIVLIDWRWPWPAGPARLRGRTTGTRAAASPAGP